MAGFVRALVLLLPMWAATAVDYSRLNPGSLCGDYQIEEITTAAECFGAAATALGLDSVATQEIDGLGFNGCMYNTAADILMFGVSDESLALSTYNYICIGIPTTTTTTITTLGPTTTVTWTGYEHGYSLLFSGEACSDFKINDIDSESECFNQAVDWLGLSGHPTLAMNGLGFTGCVYNVANGNVFFGYTLGVVGTAPSFFQYICSGIATTTTTTTTFTITTVTTSTSTVTTSTVTTATETTTTSTETTSTLTTSTSTTTTSTRTSSTSTRTTTTYTGSSSTTTSTTTVSITTQTVTTSTTSTWTTSTSTSTYTLPPNAGFVGDDPITFYNDVMMKFYLPEGEFVQLLRTPELQLFGAAKNVGPEQYIVRLAVRGPNGEEVLQVAIKEGLDRYEPGDLSEDAFETLNVTLEWANGYHLAHLPGPDAYAHRWQSLAFAFQRLQDAQIGKARAEMAIVGGASATILIMSVAALGFAGQDSYLAAKHAHLDFVLQMRSREGCEGILPELWGVKPLSNGTMALLEPVS